MTVRDIIAKVDGWFDRAQGKRLLASLLVGLAATGFCQQYGQTVQADIAQSVVRFHVLANSDSPADQQLKLKVRDGIIAYLEQPLKQATSVAQTKDLLAGELGNLERVARQIVLDNGANYPVKAVLGQFQFPTKQYGDTKFPAGTYDALRILIGGAEGQNWWCVLYPQLCFVDSRATVPDASKEKLKNVLTEDEFQVITKGGIPGKYQIKFKLVELFGR